MPSNIHIPTNLGESGWTAIIPPRTPAPSLENQQHVDFLIIGAGFAGLSAAQRLMQLQPNAKIALLEGHQVAAGAAGRNSGFMIDLPHDLSSDDYRGHSNKQEQRHTRMNRAAIAFAHAAAAEYSMPPETIQQTGKVNAAATSKGLQHNHTYAQHLEQLQEPYKQLDKKDMQDLTGIDYYHGGLWTPGTAMIQPALYIQYLADGLQQKGLILYENSPALALTRDKQQWQIKTPKGSINTPRVILAVNGLIQQFGFYQHQLMHLFTYASMTQVISPQESKQLGGQAEWAVTPADPLGTTVRKIISKEGERIIIRNSFTYNPNLASPQEMRKHIIRKHQKAYLARFPMLKHLTMQYQWGGRLCLSLNNVSAIEQLETGLYSACCHNGLGTTKGTIAGIIAAEMATNSQKNTLIEDYQPEGTPKRLWPSPIMWLGVNSQIKWKEYKAGKEF